MQKPETHESPKAEVIQKEQEVIKREQELEKQIAQLRSREKELKDKLSNLNAQLEMEKTARDSLERRFEITQIARDDAIREVVRIRARLQGMASQAEATAMFAEARVILDRMEEEAFSDGALVDLKLARSYMVRGKNALDNDNPGGAAYLFDLIPGLYESMRKDDPRLVQAIVSVAALHTLPKKSSPRVGSIYWGESGRGIEKNGDWMKIKTSSGVTGWVRSDQVR